MYALVDCNNFFVSCERVFRPDLEGKPVVVLSGNDGCIIARSNEVKALGIKMGTPLFQIRDIVKREKITCFSSNFSLYGDISSRIMSILSTKTETLQQYSIDEAFLSLDHLSEEQYKPYCEQIVQEIRRGIGVPVSIGIARTKTLAKIASHYAKKYPGYRGVCQILTEEQRIKALQGTPVDDVWGIGRKSFKKLYMAGVRTAFDLAEKSSEWIANVFTKPGVETWRELNGEDCINISSLPEKQSISMSRTFANAVTDRIHLEGEMATFVASCCHKLRKQGSACRQMIIFATTSRFRTDLNQHFLSATVDLPTASNNEQELMSYMLAALRKNYKQGMPYKQAGVIVTQISTADVVERDIFDNRDRAKDARLQQALDKVSAIYGKGQVRFAAQATGEKKEAIYNANNLSPRYTTRLSEIVTVIC